MKHSLAALVICLACGQAIAGGNSLHAPRNWGGHAEHHHHRGSWVGPALIGGLITYGIMNSRPVYAQPPIVYAPPPVGYEQPIPWNPPPPTVLPPAGPRYYYQSIIDPYCNCQRWVLRPYER